MYPQLDFLYPESQMSAASLMLCNTRESEMQVYPYLSTLNCIFHKNIWPCEYIHGQGFGTGPAIVILKPSFINVTENPFLITVLTRLHIICLFHTSHPKLLKNRIMSYSSLHLQVLNQTKPKQKSTEQQKKNKKQLYTSLLQNNLISSFTT